MPESAAPTLSAEQFDHLVHGLAERFAPLAAEKTRAVLEDGHAYERRAARLSAGLAHPGHAPDERRDFFRAVLQGDQTVLKALAERNDQGERSQGGWLVPAGFREDIVGRLPMAAELAPHVRVVPVTTDTGHVPSLATDLAVTWGGRENESFAAHDPSIGQVPWTLKRADALTKLSRELVADAPSSLVEFLLRHFQDALAQSRDRVIAAGNGVTQPLGLAVDERLDASELTLAGAPDFAALVRIEQSLPRRYRAGARWIMSAANVRRVRERTDDNGRPLFLRDGAERDARLLGYPVAQQDNIPDGMILFGDLGQYLWFDREEMGVESTTVGGDAFEKHQVWIKLWERADGRLATPDAFVRAVGFADAV